MNNALNSGMYWMMSGLPYMSSVPSVGGGRWDGSRWVRGNNTSSASSLPSAMAPTNSSGGERDTTFGADYFGGPTGMSGPFSNAALGQAAFGSAKDTLGSTLGGLGKTAAVNGVLGGLATGNIGAGISSALGAVANPGTFAGALGNLTNSAFGLSGVPGSVMGIASGIMGAINPGLGLATSIFGGFALDGLMDAFDARNQEALRDKIEDMAGNYFGGRIAGDQFAKAVDKVQQTSLKDLSWTNNMPSAISNTAARLGADFDYDQVKDLVSAAYGGGIWADHLADLAMSQYDMTGIIGDPLGMKDLALDPEAIAGVNQAMGINDITPESLNAQLDNVLGGMPSLGGYSTNTQGPADMGVSSGMQADTVSDAIDAGISAGMDAVGETEAESDTSSSNESDDSDSDDSGNEGDSGDSGGDDGGSDGPSGGMNGSDSNSSDDSDSDED